MASRTSSEADKEKYLDGVSPEHQPAFVDVVKVKDEAPDTYYVNKYGPLGPILAKLFASGVEARGVERVPEDQREEKHTWNK